MGRRRRQRVDCHQLVDHRVESHLPALARHHLRGPRERPVEEGWVGGRLHRQVDRANMDHQVDEAEEEEEG